MQAQKTLLGAKAGGTEDPDRTALEAEEKEEAGKGLTGKGKARKPKAKAKAKARVEEPEDVKRKLNFEAADTGSPKKKKKVNKRPAARQGELCADIEAPVHVVSGSIMWWEAYCPICVGDWWNTSGDYFTMLSFQLGQLIGGICLCN